MAFTPEEMADITTSVFDAFGEMLTAVEKDFWFSTHDNGSEPDRDTVEIVFRAIRSGIEERKRRLNPEPPQPSPPIDLRLGSITRLVYMNNNHPIQSF